MYAFGCGAFGQQCFGQYHTRTALVKANGQLLHVFMYVSIITFKIKNVKDLHTHLIN